MQDHSCSSYKLSLITTFVDNCTLLQPTIVENNAGVAAGWSTKSILFNFSNIAVLTPAVDFFPNLSICPEEIFNNTNEIEFVKNTKTEEVYGYDIEIRAGLLANPNTPKHILDEIKIFAKQLY